ncbi:MAG: polysaccharide deacetylase family protein [Bryobacterales bacterium]|nr:polysaccharide deacetylase family protein [Bryobacterales bacterium]
MLKQAKLAVLRAAETVGVSSLVAGGAWRRGRLLILCYHGVSMNDEHAWSDLYVSPEFFRRRMELIRQARCSVLPLDEALDRLQRETLPDRAVALTFDDGFHDFYRVAFPLLEAYGYPVTLYLTTYYVGFNRPVFDPACSYLLWKGRRRERLDWPEVFPGGAALDEAGRAGAVRRFKQYAHLRKLSGAEKDGLLRQLAERLEIDYDDLCRRRVLHLITPEEGRDLAARGVDLQLHTHRHRVYRRRNRMFQELNDNRSRIRELTPKEPRHFCYTGGFYLPEHVSQLREYGICSATTCRPGLCTRATDPLELPRLVDSMSQSDLEFRAWMAGTADLLPKRRHEMSEDQLGEEDTPGA